MFDAASAFMPAVACRALMTLFAAVGVTAIAPDWLGHGDSDKPGPDQFGYDAVSYMRELEKFIAALDGVPKPYNLVVHVSARVPCVHKV